MVAFTKEAKLQAYIDERVNLLKPKLAACTTRFHIHKFYVLPTMYLRVFNGFHKNKTAIISL